MTNQQVEKKPSRSNRVEMPGMVWNADHVLHLALKQETSDIPKNYFQDCEGILLLNIVELGVLVSGSYGTGCLFAKDDISGKWSPPCAMSIKSVGIGSFGTAVRDLMIFIMDRKSLENLASAQGLQMETGMRATLGPLGRYTTTQPRVRSKAIETYAAYAFTKGAFAGVTGDFGSVSPAKDANNRFYKTKGKSDFTPQDILFDGVATIPTKGPKTLLADVYDKLNLLSNGEQYNGSENQTNVSSPVERAPVATLSKKQSNTASKQQQQQPSLSKDASTRKQVTPSATMMATTNAPSQKPRPTATKKASAKRTAPTHKPDVEYDC